MNTELESISAFLSLRDFEEYMERLEEFLVLPSEKAVFRKEMALMESDSAHTHRQKDAIRRRKTREIVKKLHGEIDRLCDEVLQDGCYLPVDEAEQKYVEIEYRFPNGKAGDVDHAITGMCAGVSRK